MFHDILIPCRIGNYYLYNKRILSFEITPFMVSGLLIEFKSKKIEVKNQQTIFLKDFSVQAQANALKKIAGMMGAYDEIVTTLNSSTVVYKELELPFIGYDALKLIVPYEVESLLPFALEDVIIDFIVTKQDLEKKHSKLLVAAIPITDLQNLQSIFEKAELTVDVVTIDIFALYQLYQASNPQIVKIVPPTKNIADSSSSIINLWQKIQTDFLKKTDSTQQSTPIPTILQYQPKQAELLVDIGFDVVRVLYFQDNNLTSIRIIPHAISDIAQTISEQTNKPYLDILHLIATNNELETFQASLDIEIKNLFAEINRTLSFFESQEKTSYKKPTKFLFSGFLSQNVNFVSLAEQEFAASIEILNSTSIMDQLNINHTKEQSSISISQLATGLFVHFNDFVNFLQTISQKNNSRLLNKQILTMLFLTLFCLGATFWRSYIILQEKETAYNISKRQFIQAIEQHMHIDLKGEKNIKFILEKAEAKLKSEQSLWFAFSAQQENSVLEYLQDLSVQIDRSAIGLQIRQMHLDYEKVTMSGMVKDYQALDIFVEELMNLQLLQLIEKPRELAFSIELKPKNTLKGS